MKRMLIAMAMLAFAGGALAEDNWLADKLGLFEWERFNIDEHEGHNIFVFSKGGRRSVSAREGLQFWCWDGEQTIALSVGDLFRRPWSEYLDVITVVNGNEIRDWGWVKKGEQIEAELDKRKKAILRDDSTLYVRVNNGLERYEASFDLEGVGEKIKELEKECSKEDQE